MREIASKILRRLHDSQSVVHFVLLMIMGLTWGLQFAMLKLIASQGIGEIELLTLSLVCLSVIFLVILVVRGELFRPNAGHIVYFSIGSLLGYVLPLGIVLYVSTKLSAGLISLIASLAPVLTICVAVVLGTEKVSRARVMAVLLGMVATVLIFLPELSGAGDSNLAWVLVAFIVPFVYGIDGIYIGAYWPKELGALQVVAGEAVVAALMLVPFYIFFGTPLVYDPSWPAGQWGMVCFLAGAVIEVLLFFYLIKVAGAVLVSFGSLIALFAGIGWGMVIFQETHGVLFWVSILPMALALGLVALEKKQVSSISPDGENISP